jgi:hypothetical protein
MKPLFKWASSSPWTEMQLQALSAPDYATALQQIWKAVWGLVWFAVLARVLGFLMYRHYLLRSVHPSASVRPSVRLLIQNIISSGSSSDDAPAPALCLYPLPFARTHITQHSY